MTKLEFTARLILYFSGIAIMTLGISLIIKAQLGVAPWDVLHIGLFTTFGLTIGTWSQIVGFIVIIFTFIFDRTLIQIGTLLNMIFVGVFIDLYLGIMPTIDDILLQCITLIVGILLMGLGAGLYITSKLGPGPRDGLLLALNRRYHWSIRIIKTVMELSVLMIGWFLGGPVFFGTFIFALFIGPIMQFSISWWEKKLEPFFAYSKKVTTESRLKL